MVKRSTPPASLTETQAKVLSYIREHVRQHGTPPSYREIQRALGYRAVGTVQDHVKALRDKGYLESVPSGRGGVLPTSHRLEGTRRIPIYGEIAAGPLRETPQVELGSLVIAENAAREPCFALRVVGDSMIGAGIFEGDFLIVEHTQRARSGEIVVAIVEGETTVKRYIEKKDGAYLVPENPRLKPLKIDRERCEIQGRVVGLQRKFL